LPNLLPLPDPLLSNALLRMQGKLDEDGGFCTNLVCSHCFQPIRGRAYELDGKFYDRQCWRYRYSIQQHEINQRQFLEKVSRGTPVRWGKRD